MHSAASQQRMKALQFICMLFCLQHLAFFPTASTANQIGNFKKLIGSRKSESRRPNAEPWSELGFENKVYTSTIIGNQTGMMEADKINSLPGQPQGVDFDQYAGYVTVNTTAGRALFYYFVESPNNSLSIPLVLWLNGGPGCSSLGSMEELGPFIINSDGKTLYRNDYSWNNVANMIFLDSPAGVGFSYSNTSSDYQTVSEKRTAEDSYIFLINWLERFPQYKNRDFYITGQSYAGHYVPQLAYTILSNNQLANQTIINLKGIAIGNALIDDSTWIQGTYDYYWTHALNSDETHANITKYCDFANGNFTGTCSQYLDQADIEVGNIDPYAIYAPLCDSSAPKTHSPGSDNSFDPCSLNYVQSYLNLADVQRALHARDTNWTACSAVIFNVLWPDHPPSILPTIKHLIDSGLRLWVYSGDVDSVVSVTASRYAINTFKLPVKNVWRAWYSNKNEVGGYVVEYEGLVLATVRGAGHQVPSYQPERALTMISSFLHGTLPPRGF